MVQKAAFFAIEMALVSLVAAHPVATTTKPALPNDPAIRSVGHSDSVGNAFKTKKLDFFIPTLWGELCVPLSSICNKDG